MSAPTTVMVDTPTTEPGWEQLARTRWADAARIKPFKYTWEEFAQQQNYYEDRWFNRHWRHPRIYAFPHQGPIVPVALVEAYAVVLHWDAPASRWTLYTLHLFSELGWRKSQLHFQDEQVRGRTVRMDAVLNELVVMHADGTGTIYLLPTCKQSTALPAGASPVTAVRLSRAHVLTNQGVLDRSTQQWHSPLPVPPEQVSALSFTYNTRFLVGTRDGSVVDVECMPGGTPRECARHTGRYLFREGEEGKEVTPPPVWTVTGTPGGGSFTVTTESQLVMYDETAGTDSSDPCRKTRRVPETGTIMHAVSWGNITVLHHSTNHLLFVNRYTGKILQTFQNADVLRHTDQGTHAYSSVRIRHDQLTALFPSGLMLFINLREPGEEP